LAADLLKFIFRVVKTGLGFKAPFELNFALTYHCPMRCVNCRIWEIPASAGRELSLEEIRELAQKTRNLYWLRLTGGEPFLRPDYPEAVQIFQQAHPELYLLSTPTSGYDPERIERMAQQVLEGGLQARFVITVSLDGPQELHDRLRGKAGAWAKALETYAALIKLQTRHANFKALLGYTIQPQNAGRFFETIAEAGKAVPNLSARDFHLNLAQKSEIYYHNPEMEMGQEFNRAASREIREILPARPFSLSPVSLVEDMYLRLSLKYLKTGRCPIPCTVSRLSRFVNPYGEAFPCTAFNRPLGNLRDFGFDLSQIENSPAALEAAQEIRRGECPQCWTPCEAHQMLVSRLSRGGF